MKPMKLEIARVGIFGQDGTVVTKDQLREVADTFTGRAPIVLGHRLADFMPAFGYVVGVQYNDESETLLGDVELTDVLADAYDTGYYRNWSIGIRRRAEDGKVYIHHLAMLGQQPPAIRDLNVIAASEAVNMDAEEYWTTSKPQAEAAAAQEATQTDTNLSDARNGAPQGGAADQTQHKEQDMSEELKETQQKLTDAVARLRKGAKRNLLQAVEGKLPKDWHALVLELADRMPAEDAIELSDGSGEKRQVSSLELLTEIFKAIPSPVAPGEADLSDDANRNQGADYSGLAATM